MPPSTRPRRGAARATPQPASSSPLSSPAASPKRARPRGGGGGGTGKPQQSKAAPNGKKAQDLAPSSSLDSVLSTMQNNLTQTKADTARQRRVLASLDRRPPRGIKSPTAADRPVPQRAAKKAPPRRAAKRRSDELDDDNDDTDEADHTPPPPKTRRLSPVSSPPFPSSTLTPPPSTPLSAAPTASGTLPPSQPPAIPVDDSDDDDDDDLEAALAKHQAAAEKKAPAKSPDADEPVFQPTQLPPGVAVGDTALLKVKSEWFPAKLQDFRPAQEPGARDVYVLVTEDEDEASCGVNRVMFLCEEERLARASIGVCAEVKRRRRTRQSDDAPTDEYNAFRALQHEEQVGLLHDHLAELVAEAYAPAQWRIDAFFAGDAELGYAVDYGDFSPRDVEGRVLPAVTAWFARGYENDGEARDDGGEPVPTRRRGSERIEALEEGMRRAFAQDVLLPETLIAICRRSFDLEKADTWIERPDAVAAGAPADAPRDRVDSPAAGEARTGDRLRIDVPAQGPGRHYALARLKLDELMAYSAATQWERRKTEVQRARRFARAKLRLPDPATAESKALSAAAESRIERERNEAMRLQLAFDRRNERLHERRARRGGR